MRRVEHVLIPADAHNLLRANGPVVSQDTDDSGAVVRSQNAFSHERHRIWSAIMVMSMRNLQPGRISHLRLILAYTSENQHKQETVKGSNGGAGGSCISSIQNQKNSGRHDGNSNTITSSSQANSNKNTSSSQKQGSKGILVPCLPEYGTFGITVVDSKTASDSKTQSKKNKSVRVGVFLVPLGREHNYLFGVAEGQFQLCEQNGFDRMLFVLLPKGPLSSVFPTGPMMVKSLANTTCTDTPANTKELSIARMQRILGATVHKLLPSGVNASQVPYLACEPELGEGRILRRSVVNDEIVVEDVRVRADDKPLTADDVCELLSECGEQVSDSGRVNGIVGSMWPDLSSCSTWSNEWRQAVNSGCVVLSANIDNNHDENVKSTSATPPQNTKKNRKKGKKRKKKQKKQTKAPLFTAQRRRLLFETWVSVMQSEHLLFRGQNSHASHWVTNTGWLPFAYQRSLCAMVFVAPHMRNLLTDAAKNVNGGGENHKHQGGRQARIAILGGGSGNVQGLLHDLFMHNNPTNRTNTNNNSRDNTWNGVVSVEISPEVRALSYRQFGLLDECDTQQADALAVLKRSSQTQTETQCETEARPHPWDACIIDVNNPDSSSAMTFPHPDFCSPPMLKLLLSRVHAHGVVVYNLVSRDAQLTSTLLRDLAAHFELVWLTCKTQDDEVNRVLCCMPFVPCSSYLRAVSEGRSDAVCTCGIDDDSKTSGTPSDSVVDRKDPLFLWKHLHALTSCEGKETDKNTAQDLMALTGAFVRAQCPGAEKQGDFIVIRTAATDGGNETSNVSNTESKVPKESKNTDNNSGENDGIPCVSACVLGCALKNAVDVLFSSNGLRKNENSDELAIWRANVPVMFVHGKQV